MITVNKLLTVTNYLECIQYIGKEGIRNAMTRTRFKELPQNLNFFSNTKADKIDKDYKVRLLITHFNEKFSQYVSNDATQNVNEHMVKFKGRLCQE